MYFNKETHDTMFKNNNDCDKNINENNEAQFSNTRIVLVTGNISDKTTQNIIKDLGFVDQII
jgi:hypothetical protein